MTMGTPEAAPAFRGDVQGMRGVAVLAVIAAHAAVPGLGGGFVGVDVFFVISGYLITRLVLGGIEAEGRFRIGAFYARRARRIVPAATLVLTVTVIASVLYLNFLDALDATRDALWAAFFGANIRFATQGVDYFALEDSPSPVQHFWSLAVEEQFYVVWPVLVLLAMLLTRGARRRRATIAEVRYEAPPTDIAPVGTMAFFAVLVGAGSLAWSIHRTIEEPTSAYFSSFTRAWELAAGVLVALALHRRPGLHQRWLSEPLAVLGLVGIGVAVVLYDTSNAFPGKEALLPVLSTVAVLVAGAHAERPAYLSRLLAVRPLRLVGDWSYSLYLWHWPLIVIPQVHMGRSLSVTETLIAVALTFQLAYLTHRFVEQPFRTRALFRGPSWRGLVLYPASLVLVLPAVYAGYSVASYDGSEHGHDPAIVPSEYGIQDTDQVTALVEASVQAGVEGARIPSDLTPDLINLQDDIADVGECNYQYPERHLCRRGDSASDKVIVVTGDSHARAWIPAFEKIAQDAGYATYYFVKQQCAAPFVDPARLGTGEKWPECKEFHQWVVDRVRELHPDVMVIATSPPPNGVYVDGKHIESREGVHEQMALGFDEAFATYRPLVGQLLLLEDVPRLPEEPGGCLATHSLMSDCTFSPTDYNEEMRQVSVEAAERDGIPHVDPTDWLCYDDRCPLVIGSTIAYRDRSHITSTRAAELWFPLGVALGLLDDPQADDRHHRQAPATEEPSAATG